MGGYSFEQFDTVRAVRRRMLFTSIAVLGCAWSAVASAQAPRVNYLHDEFTPPGVIAKEQLRRNPGMPGYVQAIELIPPPGARISVIQHGDAQLLPVGKALLGMELGHVYSIKLTQLPNQEGLEVFPTIEIINRLYPPEGTKTRFPVTIEITEEDVAQALVGLYVVKVIYLEDSDRAFPRADDPQHQRSIDVSPSEDPLHVADRMGRPMAIVRLGSRVPDSEEISLMGFNTPPIEFYPECLPTSRSTDVRTAIERHGEDVPRQTAAPPQRGSFNLPRWQFLR
jgi:hypothetical protein